MEDPVSRVVSNKRVEDDYVSISFAISSERRDQVKKGLTWFFLNNITSNLIYLIDSGIVCEE